MASSRQRRVGSTFFTILTAAVLATCTSADKVSGPDSPSVPVTHEPPPPPPPGPPASIEVTYGFGELLVNESKVVTVLVKDSAGRAISDFTPTFTSSDTSVVQVNSVGVITGRWPGVARIEVAVLSLKGSVGVRVTSRLRIGLELLADWLDPIELAVGDTVRLKPYVSDAGGHYLEIFPTVTWSSTNPDGISVDSRGKLTALKDGATAEIRAVGKEGVGLKPVKVSIPASGPPATVRFAHAAAALGPITFVPTKGPAKTIDPGETATLEIPPGILLVQVKNASNPFHSYPSVDGITIKSGEKVTLYAIGDHADARLRWVWKKPGTIPPDKALVDVMQGVAGYPVMYMLRDREPLNGTPAECYFDWTDISAWEGPPGPLDLFFLGKYPSKEVREQLRVEAKGGMRTTVILAGTLGNMSYFSFPDP